MPDFDDAAFEAYPTYESAPAPKSESLPTSAPVAYAEPPDASLALYQDDTFSEIAALDADLLDLKEEEASSETKSDHLAFDDELEGQSTDQTLTSVEKFLAFQRAHQPVRLSTDAESLTETTASADQFLSEQQPVSVEMAQSSEIVAPDIGAMTTEAAPIGWKDLDAVGQVSRVQDQSNAVTTVEQPSVEVEMIQPPSISTQTNQLMQQAPMSMPTVEAATSHLAVAPTQVEASSNLASPQPETVSSPALIALNETVVVAPQEVPASEIAVEAPPLSKWLDATLNDAATNNAPVPEAIAAGPIPQPIAAEAVSVPTPLGLESPQQPSQVPTVEVPSTMLSTAEQLRPAETLQSASLEMFLLSDVTPEVQLVQHQAELQRLLSLQGVDFVPSDAGLEHSFAYAGNINDESTWRKLLLEQQAMVKLCQMLVAYQYDLAGFAAQVPTELAALGISVTVRMGDQADQQAELSAWVRPGKDHPGSWMEMHHQDGNEANKLEIVLHGPTSGTKRNLTEKAVDIGGQ